MELILILVIFALAFFFQSLFGFGASFLAIVGLSFFMPAEQVIGMLPVVLIASTSIIVFRNLQSVRWKTILTVFLVSLPGVLSGGLLLRVMDSREVIIVVTSLILIHSIYTLFVRSLSIPNWLIYPLLVLSGGVIGTSGLGLVYVPLVLQRIKEPEEIRVSLNFLWLLLAVTRIPVYLAGGVTSPELLLKGMITIPGILLLMFLGKRIHELFDVESFHRTMIILLALISLARLIVGITEM